ncbi:hypothetical protein [Actinomadura montaniterrae]|nr:hypothetical protein [Actinomadura montaniterrae]
MEISEEARRFAETAPPLTDQQKAAIRQAFTPPPKALRPKTAAKKAA